MTQEKSAKRKYDGMTLNERLLDAGLLAAFDDAVRTANRERMIEILAEVEIESQAAARTANSILTHPTRFGRC